MFNNKQSSLRMNLRCQTVRGIKDNFHTFYKNDTICPLQCNTEIDSQEHMLKCHKIRSKLTLVQKDELGQVIYSDLFGNIQQQHRITKVFQFLLRIRDRLLDNTQGPAYHGNSSGPIY